MKRNPVAAIALFLALLAVPACALAYELTFEPIPGSSWTLTIPDDFFRQVQPSASPSATPAATPGATPSPTPSARPTASPRPTPAPTPTGQAAMNAYEQQMLSLVNAERVKAGKTRLSADPRLTYWARAKSADMIEEGYFAHQSPTYGSAAQMLRAAGISFTACGENIARYGSLEKAHAGLMSSAGHRANILNGAMRFAGIGVVRDAAGNFYVTELFVR